MAGLWQSAVLVVDTFCQQDNVRLSHASCGMVFTYTCLQVLLPLVWWLHPFRDWIYVDTMNRLQLGQWRNTHMHMLSCLLPCKLPPFSGPSPDTPNAINSCSFCLLILVQLKVNLFTGQNGKGWEHCGYSLSDKQDTGQPQHHEQNIL
jgi:hypothetical protein